MIFEAVLSTITKNSSVGVKYSIGISQRFCDYTMNMSFLSFDEKKRNRSSYHNISYVSIFRTNSHLQFKPPKKLIS